MKAPYIQDFKNMDIVERLKPFIVNEVRSCSMDFGCITPEYVYRMWGDGVAIEDIAAAMMTRLLA